MLLGRLAAWEAVRHHAGGRESRLAMIDVSAVVTDGGHTCACVLNCSCGCRCYSEVISTQSECFTPALVEWSGVEGRGIRAQLTTDLSGGEPLECGRRDH